MSGKMNLQVDAGNSFIKWRVLDAERVVLRGREDTSNNVSMSEIDVWDGIGSVSISSVASGGVDRSLQGLFRENLPNVTPFFAKSQALFGGVANAYKDPAQLGVDRWLAVIAGFSKYNESCFVVDCGSAITIDLVDAAGRHQGGYILPGIELMKRSLSAGTKRVEFDSLCGQGIKYGETTSECVQAGVSFAMLSVFEGLLSRMAGDQVKRLIVTGGDGAYASSLSQSIEYYPDLVFEGLSLVDGVGC